MFNFYFIIYNQYRQITKISKTSVHNLKSIFLYLQIQITYFYYSQIISLPRLAPNKSRIHIYRLKDYDASKYDVRIAIRYVCVFFNIHIRINVSC